MEITDIKLDKKYLHPKHGPGEIIAARQDDGAALIFQPFDSKGDTGDWNDPLYQVEAWELIEFTQEQWDQRYL